MIADFLLGLGTYAALRRKAAGRFAFTGALLAVLNPALVYTSLVFWSPVGLLMIVPLDGPAIIAALTSIAAFAAAAIYGVVVVCRGTHRSRSGRRRNRYASAPTAFVVGEMMHLLTPQPKTPVIPRVTGRTGRIRDVAEISDGLIAQGNQRLISVA